jgi:hypothetical protein
VPVRPADRRLRLIRQALAELEHAADDYDEARTGLGARFLLAVEKAIDSIHAAPHRWPRVDDRHHRVLVHRFPFAVFYRFDDAEVIIVAVAHRRRRPGYWSRR